MNIFSLHANPESLKNWGANTKVKTHSSTQWYENGVLHRDGDLPAYISAQGNREWWKNGVEVARSEEEYYRWKNRK